MRTLLSTLLIVISLNCFAQEKTVCLTQDQAKMVVKDLIELDGARYIIHSLDSTLRVYVMKSEADSVAIVSYKLAYEDMEKAHNLMKEGREKDKLAFEEALKVSDKDKGNRFWAGVLTGAIFTALVAIFM